MKVTIGGDRLGSGKKMRADLHGYERSTHDLGNMFASSMAPGTLVPIYKKVCLPGDSWDIELGAQINTLPTNGPLFGTYKLQIDFFYAAIRLYQGLLHMNATGIGNRMQNVLLPQIEMTSTVIPSTHPDIDNSQVNPSCLLSYLGIRGVGMSAATQQRTFNATPILMYWDTVKQYYMNQQEEVGYVIHTETGIIIETVLLVTAKGETVTQSPAMTAIVMSTSQRAINVSYVVTPIVPSQIMFNTSAGQIAYTELCAVVIHDAPNDIFKGQLNYARWGDITIYSWEYQDPTTLNSGEPDIESFPITQIDDMRRAILAETQEGIPFVINDADLLPYKWLYEQPNGNPNALNSMEGLALKTYQSDIYQNWLNSTWIGDINTASAVSTASGSFTQDQLLLAKKIYDQMNRVAVSGGSYYDWIDVSYTESRYNRHETPIYLGGLIKEITFAEVVSHAESTTEQGSQPLGTQAGRGVLMNKHKGGRIHHKCDEHGYIMGLASITPRLYYTQGNDFDINLVTMDDFFKPAMEQLGFEDSINEYRAWWSTEYTGGNWVQSSVGKIPAWTNYMTSVNKALGDFAIADKLMFMILSRRYRYAGGTIEDLTTYIDPRIYNYIFAQTSLDAQNFWVQIAIDAEVRRIMSAKLMPNL